VLDLRPAIDLSTYDSDGNPQASAVRIVNVGGAAKAFVTLERLDDKDQLKSKQPSLMLRVDVRTARAEEAVTLQGRNPFGMTESGGVFFLAEPGNFDAADEPFAGVERFDPRSSTSAMIAHEKELGGSVAEVAISRGCGVAILANAVPNVNATSLVSFDATTGALKSTLLPATPGFDLMGLAWVAGETVLLVGDRRSATGAFPLHVFDRTGECDFSERPSSIALSQKPVALRALN
jgi:hypothetical protein